MKDEQAPVQLGDLSQDVTPVPAADAEKVKGGRLTDHQFNVDGTSSSTETGFHIHINP